MGWRRSFCFRRNYQAWRQSFHGTNRRKRRTRRSSSCRNLHLWRNSSHVCRTQKLQWLIFTGIQRMEIRLQSETGWTKIRWPHGWKCRLERNEHLGKMVWRRDGICKLPIFWRQTNHYGIFGANVESNEQR